MKKALIIFFILLPALAQARTLQLLQLHYLLSNPPHSYWNFNAGNSNDYEGAFNGADTSMSYSSGLFGKSAVFNGTSSFISLANNSLFSTSTISWNFWIDPAALPASGATVKLIDKRDDASGTNGYNYELLNNSGTQEILAASKNADTWGTWTATLTTNAWTMLTFVKSGSSVTLYINGVSKGTGGSNLTYTDFSTNLRVGEGTDGSGTLNGKIDDLQFYTSALTQAEITRLASSRSIEGPGISR